MTDGFCVFLIFIRTVQTVWSRLEPPHFLLIPKLITVDPAWRDKTAEADKGFGLREGQTGKMHGHNFCGVLDNIAASGKHFIKRG